MKRRTARHAGDLSLTSDEPTEEDHTSRRQLHVIRFLARANELSDARRQVVDGKVGEFEALEMHLEVRLGDGRCATGVG